MSDQNTSLEEAIQELSGTVAQVVPLIVSLKADDDTQANNVRILELANQALIANGAPLKDIEALNALTSQLKPLLAILSPSGTAGGTVEPATDTEPSTPAAPVDSIPTEVAQDATETAPTDAAPEVPTETAPADAVEPVTPPVETGTPPVETGTPLDAGTADTPAAVTVPDLQPTNPADDEDAEHSAQISGVTPIPTAPDFDAVPEAQPVQGALATEDGAAI